MESNGCGPDLQYDYLILGAGPAGLQMGYYLEKAGRNYLILEAGQTVGTFFKSFPRHRRLLSINKIHTGYEDAEINLRWDWNSLLSDREELLFKHYSNSYFPSAEDLINYLQDFATQCNLKIKYGTRITKIKKNDHFTLVDAQGNSYSCKYLIIAAGFTKPNVPAIPGAELAELYTEVSVDPENFAKQRVLIIGKGNSGFETASNLIGTTSLIHIVSPQPVVAAWKTKFVGHLRAINNDFLDTYQLKSQNVVLDASVDRIERRDGRFAVTFSYSHAAEEQEELIYDRVILCTGWRFDNSIFDESSSPAMVINDRLPDQNSEWESVNVKDLYFAGTLMQVRDYKEKQSGFIHGFRYNISALHKMLERKNHNQEWPHRLMDVNPEALTEAIIKRVNVSSGLWQQTGYISDLIVVSAQDQTARYYEDVPVDYVNDGGFGRQDHYYVITLEFGLDRINASPDIFAIQRIHKNAYQQAELSTGIHPIVRRYSKGELIAEHHVIEDIASEWLEDVHSGPLLNFLDSDLKQVMLVGVD